MFWNLNDSYTRWSTFNTASCLSVSRWVAKRNSTKFLQTPSQISRRRKEQNIRYSSNQGSGNRSSLFWIHYDHFLNADFLLFARQNGLWFHRQINCTLFCILLTLLWLKNLNVSITLNLFIYLWLRKVRYVLFDPYV